MMRSGPNGKTRCSRRGISLTECLVVVTAVAAMLGLCAVTIQLLLRVNGDGQARVTSALAFERLARQFRTDVHTCADAELAAVPRSQANPANLVLKYERARIVTYGTDLLTGTVSRNETQSGKMTSHEAYALGRSHQARFELFDESPRRWAKVVVTRNSSNKPDPARPIEVLALRGKSRLAGAVANEGRRP
jgi:hypothetical protein